MKHFSTMEIKEAYDHIEEGGQALHTHNIIVDERRAPQCFVRAIRRGEWIAHLFDLDSKRLVKTARELGVNVIFIDGEGTNRQHIDLCGSPLKRALVRCGLKASDIYIPKEQEEQEE